jgi:hypothetical protein
MKLYHYNDLGYFVKESTAVSDPEEKEEKFLIPRNASTKKPPAESPKKLRKFIVLTDSWTLIDDNRGKEYWDSDGRKYVIILPEETIPAGAILQGPLSNLKLPKYIDGQWIETWEDPTGPLKIQLEAAKSIADLKIIILQMLTPR